MRVPGEDKGEVEGKLARGGGDASLTCIPDEGGEGEGQGQGWLEEAADASISYARAPAGQWVPCGHSPAASRMRR